MDKWLFRAMIALALVGLMVSIYMTIYKYTGNDGMCLGSGDCSTVNASRFSEVYGIPVAALGVVGYAAILMVLTIEKRVVFFRKNGALTVFGMALLGFLFTLYLVYLEIWVIRALCPFCVTSQVAMTILFALSVARLFQYQD